MSSKLRQFLKYIWTFHQSFQTFSALRLERQRVRSRFDQNGESLEVRFTDLKLRGKHGIRSLLPSRLFWYQGNFLYHNELKKNDQQHLSRRIKKIKCTVVFFVTTWENCSFKCMISSRGTTADVFENITQYQGSGQKKRKVSIYRLKCLLSVYFSSYKAWVKRRMIVDDS